jgi:hypothetical protein
VRRGLTPSCAHPLRPPLSQRKEPQGKGNVILFSAAADRIGESSGQFHTRERLGGRLKFYCREAA